MSKFTPYYRGFIVIGGVNIPVLPNATYSNPENWSIPPIVGNLWQYDYGDGLRQPVLDCSFVVRNTTAEALSLALWTPLLARSNNISFDTPYIGSGGGPPKPNGGIGTGPAGDGYGTLDVNDGITFWDGASGVQMTGAKAASFSLSCTKGDDIRLTVRFMGTGQQYVTRKTDNTFFTNIVTSVFTPPYVPPTNPYSVLRFNRLLFGNQSGGAVTGFTAFPNASVDGIRSGGAYSFSINFNNNITPDLGMNGTVYPSGLNSGMQTCSVNYSIQAGDNAFVDNYSQPTPGALAGLAVAICDMTPAKNAIAVFSMANLLDTSPDERAMSAPRVMRNHSLVALGGDPVSNPPLSFISAAGDVIP